MPINVNAAGAEKCKPIYGGGENCGIQDKLLIDKKVQIPGSSKFTDNLTQSNAKYKAGDKISFEITVTNKSKNALREVIVADKFPTSVSFTSGPGNFDNKTKTLNFKLSNLKVNEIRKFIIVGTVNDSVNSTCLVNYISAKSGSLKADDNSKFCLEKSVCTDNQPVAKKTGYPVMQAPKGITKTPATGPEALPLLSLIPLALGGFYIRKKA